MIQIRNSIVRSADRDQNITDLEHPWVTQTSILSPPIPGRACRARHSELCDVRGGCPAPASGACGADTLSVCIPGIPPPTQRWPDQIIQTFLYDLKNILNVTGLFFTPPQAVLRIRDVYPGSRILILTHLGSRIQKQQQKRGVKKYLLS
jgi:hypothetical protein